MITPRTKYYGIEPVKTPTETPGVAKALLVRFFDDKEGLDKWLSGGYNRHKLPNSDEKVKIIESGEDSGSCVWVF